MPRTIQSNGLPTTGNFIRILQAFHPYWWRVGQIVVMDNLQAHKSARVKQAIEANCCQLLFLPGYSPDLSPTEEAFSKLKTLLRRAAART